MNPDEIHVHDPDWLDVLYTAAPKVGLGCICLNVHWKLIHLRVLEISMSQLHVCLGCLNRVSLTS